MCVCHTNTVDHRQRQSNAVVVTSRLHDHDRCSNTHRVVVAVGVAATASSVSICHLAAVCHTVDGVVVASGRNVE